MWLLVYGSADEVAGLAPDFSLLAGVRPGRIIATAPGRDCDFVSRFFAPDAGVLEDPVTGSSHCTLMPYWASRLGKTKLHARQLSRRGGELWCELENGRVKMAGRAIPYLRGRITV
jgi:predicted PhzF superfamily epimerase YddE/YHI9